MKQAMKELDSMMGFLYDLLILNPPLTKSSIITFLDYTIPFGYFYETYLLKLLHRAGEKVTLSYSKMDYYFSEEESLYVYRTRSSLIKGDKAYMLLIKDKLPFDKIFLLSILRLVFSEMDIYFRLRPIGREVCNGSFTFRFDLKQGKVFLKNSMVVENKVKIKYKAQIEFLKKAFLPDSTLILETGAKKVKVRDKDYQHLFSKLVLELLSPPSQLQDVKLKVCEDEEWKTLDLTEFLDKKFSAYLDSNSEALKKDISTLLHIVEGGELYNGYIHTLQMVEPLLASNGLKESLKAYREIFKKFRGRIENFLQKVEMQEVKKMPTKGRESGLPYG